MRVKLGSAGGRIPRACSMDGREGGWSLAILSLVASTNGVVS